MTELIQIEKVVRFPISVTEKALKTMLQVRESDDDLNESFMVRISCKGGGCSGMKYNLDFDDEMAEDDHVKEFSQNEEAIKVVIDPFSATYLKGVVINYVTKGLIGGFKFEGGDEIKKQCACGSSFGV